MKWLLDPAWGDLIREADARTPDTPCGDLAVDSDAFTERFYGAPSDPPGEDGPAVERREIDGVLVIRLRRLYGTPEVHRVLEEWAGGADRDFAYDRIVVDLRHNTGGNDGFVYDWIERRLRAVAGFASDTSWIAGGRRLGGWNRAVWRHALYGEELPERPEGELELEHETYDLPAGDRPWTGRMLVLVDRASRSSGESSAWLLREGLGARLLGEPTFGMIEYGNVVPYVLPESGLAISLATKHNDYGFPIEHVGFPVDAPLDPATPVEDVVRQFDTFV